MAGCTVVYFYNIRWVDAWITAVTHHKSKTIDSYRIVENFIREAPFLPEILYNGTNN